MAIKSFFVLDFFLVLFDKFGNDFKDVVAELRYGDIAREPLLINNVADSYVQ